MKFYIGLHEHRHGTTPYLFQSETPLTLADFESHLGEEYEPERGESISIDSITPEAL